jgi:antitoxin (DNA-binding transcriptional repressor) of toxin-antitoxin stability system
MLESKIMEVPITQFRKNLFELVNQAFEGKDVWVSHKGSRLRLVPERKTSKLSRITPMQIIVPESDLEAKSWKVEMMKGWERKWDRKLGPIAKPARVASATGRAKTGKARLTK